MSIATTSLCDLGACPTGQHKTDFRQCGFAGCVDLRSWAKARRYRFRLEGSYKAETDPHVKGDGRWFVEVVCRYGSIYPKGDEMLLAYATRGVKRHIASLGADVHPDQSDGDNQVFRFPLAYLDEVAAILKPKRLPGKAELSPEHREKLKQHAFQGGCQVQESTFRADERENPGGHAEARFRS